VSVRPEYGPAWVNLGYRSEQEGDLEGALEKYRRGAVLQPAAAEPRVRVGRLLARLGRREEARDSCRAALRLDPRSVSAANCLWETEVLPAPAVR